MPASRNAAPVVGATEQPIAGLLARRVACEAVASLLGRAGGRSLEEALRQAGRDKALSPNDAGLAKAIATATFRRFGYLRKALAERMVQGLPTDPRLLALLATGAAQILDLTVADHAAVDLAVRLAKADPQQRHLSGLVNAVLRRLARERDMILAAQGDPLDHNTPAWLAARWRAAFGEATARSIAAAHLIGAPVDLTLKGDPAEWQAHLGGLALPLGSLRLAGIDTPITELPGYGEGNWWVQDAAAALPARLIQARPGERIADLCAAPGGKTAQLAAAGAQVLAVDRSAPRLDRLRENLARLGLEAQIHVGDALVLPETDAFDAVLLDAPCSSSGTIRRHPDVAWTKSEGDIARLAELQSRLLDKAARLVRPGGRLVYCTCSLEPEEGEAQIAAFLGRNPHFARMPVSPAELAGHAEMVDSAGDLRTLPCHLGGGDPQGVGGLDGFFASRLQRAV